MLRFKAEGYSTTQALPTYQLGTPRCNMKEGHEYTDITGYLHKPEGACSGSKLSVLRFEAKGHSTAQASPTC